MCGFCMFKACILCFIKKNMGYIVCGSAVKSLLREFIFYVQIRRSEEGNNFFEAGKMLLRYKRKAAKSTEVDRGRINLQINFLKVAGRGLKDRQQLLDK